MTDTYKDSLRVPSRLHLLKTKALVFQKTLYEKVLDTDNWCILFNVIFTFPINCSITHRKKKRLLQTENPCDVPFVWRLTNYWLGYFNYVRTFNVLCVQVPCLPTYIDISVWLFDVYFWITLIILFKYIQFVDKKISIMLFIVLSLP